MGIISMALFLWSLNIWSLKISHNYGIIILHVPLQKKLTNWQDELGSFGEEYFIHGARVYSSVGKPYLLPPVLSTPKIVFLPPSTRQQHFILV
jgi:hypothetical protein